MDRRSFLKKAGLAASIVGGLSVAGIEAQTTSETKLTPEMISSNLDKAILEIRQEQKKVLEELAGLVERFKTVIDQQSTADHESEAFEGTQKIQALSEKLDVAQGALKALMKIKTSEAK